MKTYVPLVAAGAAAALILAGCSGDGEVTDASPSPSGSDALGFGADADVATLAEIDWSEDADGVPTLDFEQPSSVGETATLVLDTGDGDAIESGSMITLNYTITSGGDGTVLYSTYEAEAPESLLVDQGTLTPVLWDALSASSTGADILFASIDGTAEDPEQATVYMALTVSDVQTPLETAQGTEVEPEAGLPAITFGEDGTPEVSFEGTEMPDELVVQPLIEGEGEALEPGDTAVVHYTGWVWDGDKFDSSWDRGTPSSFPFVDGGLIDGWIEGLSGQPVGSRVLLVIPPEQGYGEQGSGEAIPGGATLVFVVDILAAV